MTRFTRYLRTLFLAGAYCMCFCTPSLGEPCAPPQLKNTVRMIPLGDQGVAVPITLNGVEKKFLFDTGGGSVNYISSAVVRELGLEPFSSSYRSADVNGNTFNDSVVVHDVTFGTVEANDVQFQVYPDLPFDGILSSGSLAAEDLDIDFGAGLLSFFSSDHCEGGVAYWRHQVLAVVPATLANGHMEFPVALDGHPLTAVIDTGTQWSSLNLASAGQKLGFSPEVGASQSSDALKDDPARQIYFRRYSTLSFEGVTINNPLVIVRPIQFGGAKDPCGSSLQDAFAEMNRHVPDLIIGIELLRHLHMYYAVKEQKIYISPATTNE